jgi:UDP-2-acetamido-2-deoxy-ribo-hexuluronate aminotransferase
LQKCFSELGYKTGDLPVTEKICNEVLSLPVYSELSREQIEFVAKTILDFYNS